MSLYGLLVRLPVDGLYGGRALYLDVSRLAECFILHPQPQPEDAGESALAVLYGGVGHQHGLGGLLSVDVPVELGCRHGADGAAVGGDEVSLLVPRERAGDDWSLVWEICNRTGERLVESQSLTYLSLKGSSPSWQFGREEPPRTPRTDSFPLS